jgi:protein TonB
MGYETATASSRRLQGLALAIVFHIILLYGLMSGLGREIVQQVKKTVNVAIIDEPKPPPPPPEVQPEALPKADVKRPKAYVPQVETKVKASPDTDRAITSTSTSAADATPLVQQAPASMAPAPAAPAKPKVISPRLMKGCSLPVYPQRSLDKGEEGLVVFNFLIGLDGSVKSSSLVQSSGFGRLDEAAKRAFEKCKFTPGMVDGAPAQAWVRQPFRWRLQ